MQKDLELLQEICQSIEDKILERGSLTAFFGEFFNLEIYVVKAKGGFCLKISISEPNKKPRHQAIVEITNYINKLFSEVLEFQINKTEAMALKSKWIETILLIDDKIVFVID